MPYIWSRYETGSTSLSFSLLSGRYDIGSGDSPAPLTPLSGNGDLDAYGADRAPRRSQTVTIDEEYINAGRNASIKAWKALHRTKGKLYRKDEDTGIYQWTTARLRVIPISRGIENIDEQAISLSFLLYNPLWYSLHHGLGWYLNAFPANYLNTGLNLNENLDRQPLTAGGSTASVWVNAGDETVENAIVTVNAGDTAVTSVRFVQSSLGIDFTWAGTIAATKSLVIDFGALTVYNDGIKAYAGITRNAGHTADAHIAFPLPPGSTTYSVSVVGGGTLDLAYIVADFYDGSN